MSGRSAESELAAAPGSAHQAQRARVAGSRETPEASICVAGYQQREGWSHSDLLRLAHPNAPSPQHDAVFRWMLNGADSLGEREVKRKVRGEDRIAKYAAVGALPRLIEAFERVKRSSNVIEVVKLIDEFDLPREAIPTQWLNEVAVWDALLQQMPITAMVRKWCESTAFRRPLQAATNARVAQREALARGHKRPLTPHRTSQCRDPACPP